MEARERDRLVRRALSGDRASALKWHAVMPGRAAGVVLPSTTFHGVRSPFGQVDVNVQIEVDDEGNVYASAHSYLERGTFSCAWILFEDERTVGRSFSDVDVRRHETNAERERRQQEALEFQRALEPMVVAWVDENAERVGRCFARIAADKSEWQDQEVERLRAELARAEERLANRVIEELKARRDVSRPWRSA